MGKMNEISRLLETADEKGLEEFFGSLGWRKSVAKIGGKEFIKAFDEMKEENKIENITGDKDTDALLHDEQINQSAILCDNKEQN